MKKLITMTALGLCVVSLAACKGDKSDMKKAADDAGAKIERTVDNAMDDHNETKVTGYTKAQYMTACQQTMTETQCECFVDFYQSIGLKVTELGDSEKLTAAMKGLSAEKMAEMGNCMN